MIKLQIFTPEKIQNNPVTSISYESFVNGIVSRGMDRFTANGPQIILDTTDFTRIDQKELLQRIINLRENMQY